MYYRVIWLMGLRDSGKSTVAGIIKEIRPDVIVLDQDVVNLSWGEADLKVHEAGSMARVAASLLNQGFPVVIAAQMVKRPERDEVRKFAPSAFVLLRRDALSVKLARRESDDDFYFNDGEPFAEIATNGLTPEATAEQVIGIMETLYYDEEDDG